MNSTVVLMNERQSEEEGNNEKDESHASLRIDGGATVKKDDRVK